LGKISIKNTGLLDIQVKGYLDNTEFVIPAGVTVDRFGTQGYNFQQKFTDYRLTNTTRHFVDGVLFETVVGHINTLCQANDFYYNLDSHTFEFETEVIDNGYTLVNGLGNMIRIFISPWQQEVAAGETFDLYNDLSPAIPLLISSTPFKLYDGLTLLSTSYPGDDQHYIGDIPFNGYHSLNVQPA